MAEEQLVHSVDNIQQGLKQAYARIGAVCLLLIIPVKALRMLSEDLAVTVLVGISPSLLGPAGALFFLLASSGSHSRLSLFQTTLLVGLTSIALEFLQLLPRPGFLAAISYTFDPLDVISSFVSVTAAALVARWMRDAKRREL